MNSQVAILFFAFCAVCHATSPELELTLGKPSIDKNDWLNYSAKITNKSKKSVWIYSVTEDGTLLSYSAYIRAGARGKWEMLPFARCRLGDTLFELKPNTSVSFKTLAISEDAGQQYRIELAVHPSLEGREQAIKLFSNTVTIPKVVEQPGAGQPATQPADKGPAEVQPPTPTSKDAPR